MGKVLLITGGTGSFGTEALDYFLTDQALAEIRIFSRDEKKQEELRDRFNSSRLTFYIGDVRDYKSALSATEGVDYVFHAAALKQVPSCEFWPVEAVATNVIGTENMVRASIRNGVKKFVLLSTDKSVYPVNAMGMTKALAEKIVISESERLRKYGNKTTELCITRYGNVLMSRGSVVPLFLSQIRKGSPVTITDPTMTRFTMTLRQAVELVKMAFSEGVNGDIWVLKSNASTIGTLAEALRIALSLNSIEKIYIGPRHGEKKHETLISSEEMIRTVEYDGHYVIKPDSRGLDYNLFLNEGNPQAGDARPYDSSVCNYSDIGAAMGELVSTLKEELRRFNA